MDRQRAGSGPARARQHVAGQAGLAESSQRRLPLEIADLFPYARVEPAGTGGNERLLASLPVRLEPGPLARPVPDDGPPVMLGLGLAWASVLLAVVGGVTLLAGAMALTERRAVFVSAVTHELRTPLTTFRAYTEMLSRTWSPRARAPNTSATLHREAERLAHLTENVLPVRALERGPGGEPGRGASWASCWSGCAPRLGEPRRRGRHDARAIAPKLDGRVGAATPAPSSKSSSTPVDNACKYAAVGERPPIRIQGGGASGRDVIVTVERSRTGDPRRGSRRLFRRSAAPRAARRPRPRGGPGARPVPPPGPGHGRRPGVGGARRGRLLRLTLPVV